MSCLIVKYKYILSIIWIWIGQLDAHNPKELTAFWRHSRQNVPNKHLLIPLDLSSYVINACEQVCMVMIAIRGRKWHA